MKTRLNITSFLLGAACATALGAGYLALAGPIRGGGETAVGGSAALINGLRIPYAVRDRVSIGEGNDSIEFSVAYGIEHGVARIDIAPTGEVVGGGLRIARLVSCPDGQNTYTFEAAGGEIHLANVPAEKFVHLTRNTISWDVKLYSADGGVLWGMSAGFDLK